MFLRSIFIVFVLCVFCSATNVRVIDLERDENRPYQTVSDSEQLCGDSTELGDPSSVSHHLENAFAIFSPSLSLEAFRHEHIGVIASSYNIRAPPV